MTDIYNEAILNTTATFDLEPKTLESRKAWFLQRPARYPIVVYEENGTVLGWASLSLWSDKMGYIDTVENSLYVSPAARGRGVGKLMLDKLITMGRQNGIHLILARIADGNETSLRLHRSCGFESVGILKEAGKKFGRLIDVHLYQLLLK